VWWIVDAMNVIGSRPDGWWKDRRQAIVRLVERLDRWAAAEGNRVTVVLEKPMSPPINSVVVEIAQAPRAAADSADDEIVRLVRNDRRPQDITVVTSDRKLADRLRGIGASVSPAATFRARIESLH
jgi:predicted RNA-binding protein with PIN domain